MSAPLPRELAARVATTATGIEGVRSALVCSADGAVLGASGLSDPHRDAALTSFVALRAEALPVDGDLRGMGKQLAGSCFQQLAINGPSGDSLVLSLVPGAYLAVRVAPGKAAAASGPLGALARRVSSLPQTPVRSPQP